ncbi:MAG: extracellular solute-binding protein [Planctomycetes bacterium]|nr:extracellular solute-binding protein [Planctomycetota bacterium]
MSPRLVRCLVLLTAVIGSGCGDDAADEGPAAPPFTGRMVHALVPSVAEARDRWPPLLAEFKTEWGAEVELEVYERAGAAVTVPAPADSQPTVLVLPLPHIAQVAHRHPLAAIPRDEQTAEGDRRSLAWAGLFAGLRNNVCSLDGHPTVMPISAPVLVCYYREDLLDRAGLEPPETWDDYQRLLETLDEWALGLVAVEPWGDDFRATMFLARSVAFARHPDQYSLFFDVETGQPLIDSPGFVRGLESAARAMKHLPESVRNFSPADCRREMLAGRAALAIGLEPFGSVRDGIQTDRHATSDAGDRATAVRPENVRLGVTPLPGAREVYNPNISAWEQPRGGPVHRVPLTGFAGYAVAVLDSGNDASRKPAWKLVERVAVSELEAAFPPSLLSPCRHSQLERLDGWTGAELSSEEAASYLGAIAASLENPQLVAELPVVGRERFLAALATGVEPALAGEATAADALSDVASQWRKVLDELGVETVRASYRRALGVP